MKFNLQLFGADLPVPKGYKNLYLAEILTDDENGTTYDTPFQLRGGAVSIDVAENIDQAEFYNDDQATIVEVTKGPADVTISLKSLSDAERILMFGETQNGDWIEEANKDIPKEFALMYEVSMSAGKSEFVQKHRVKFKPNSRSNETENDTTNFQPIELVGRALPRISDGKSGKRHLETNTTLVDAFRTAFFADANDTVAPILSIVTVPVDGGSGIAVDSVITFTIENDNEFLASTVTAANIMLLEDGVGEVANVISISIANDVITITPDSNLSAITDYTAVLTSAVKDIYGRSAETVVNFTTA